MLEEATQKYEGAVTGRGEAFLRARGIDLTAEVTFRLGVVADPLPGHEKFHGWLAIPYLDKHSKTLSMRFRCIQQHKCRDAGHGKYMSMFEEPTRVFNVRAIHQADDVIDVCEGELDAVILGMLGLHAIAIPGARAWMPYHSRMLAGFNKVRVWGDPDEAGAEFVQKVTRSLRSAEGVRLRAGDVTDTFVKGGSAAVLELAS